MPKSVLVIDDDLTTVSLLKSRLGKEGYFVLSLLPKTEIFQEGVRRILKRIHEAGS